MPTYDYRCEANEKVVEVRHAMSLSIATWGELCEVAGIDAGETPAASPVNKILNTGGVVRSSSLKNPEAPPCMTGQGCAGGHCGF